MEKESTFVHWGSESLFHSAFQCFLRLLVLQWHSVYQITFFPIFDFRHFSSLLCSTNQRRKTKVRKVNETVSCLVYTETITSPLHPSSLAWAQCGVEENHPLAQELQRSASPSGQLWYKVPFTSGLNRFSDWDHAFRIKFYVYVDEKVLKFSSFFYFNTMRKIFLRFNIQTYFLWSID